MSSCSFIRLLVVSLCLISPILARPANDIEDGAAAFRNGPLRSPDRTCGGQMHIPVLVPIADHAAHHTASCNSERGWSLRYFGRQEQLVRVDLTKVLAAPAPASAASTQRSAFSLKVANWYSDPGYNSRFLTPMVEAAGSTNYAYTDSAYGPCCSEAVYCGSAPSYCGYRYQGQADQFWDGNGLTRSIIMQKPEMATLITTRAYYHSRVRVWTRDTIQSKRHWDARA
ncbi:uncharacterized protein RAG0_01043 [Rhynchosporium agropyri]|uniref:Uncharacterized protein n=1 Tax=Rhynchosporium agropyri TaxID=914238 RepID=A0A1E1JV62_9HELO|nr:uncharacterized protein RAG0_01043 [Rhynchosporium agropyri]